MKQKQSKKQGRPKLRKADRKGRVVIYVKQSIIDYWGEKSFRFMVTQAALKANEEGLALALKESIEQYKPLIHEEQGWDFLLT